MEERFIVFKIVRNEAIISSYLLLCIKNQDLSLSLSLSLSLRGNLYDIFLIFFLKDFLAQVKLQPQFLYCNRKG